MLLCMKNMLIGKDFSNQYDEDVILPFGGMKHSHSSIWPQNNMLMTSVIQKMLYMFNNNKIL